MIVAIDGPAGAGKSSVARAAARRLGFTYLDSGAMYRCVGLAVLRGGEAPARAWARTLATNPGPAARRDEVERLVAMMDEPDYRAVQLLGYATWATRT